MCIYVCIYLFFDFISSGQKDPKIKVRRRCTHSSLSVPSKIPAVNFLEFTVHVSKETFTFGEWKFMLPDLSGFAVIVYNASLINVTTNIFKNVSAFC